MVKYFVISREAAYETTSNRNSGEKTLAIACLLVLQRWEKAPNAARTDVPNVWTIVQKGRFCRRDAALAEFTNTLCHFKLFARYIAARFSGWF